MSSLQPPLRLAGARLRRMPRRDIPSGMRRRDRNPAERLRLAVDAMPPRVKEAMLRGVDANRIIVGAYVDRDGGICPMLAAHRNGGRVSLASFARAWDRYTGAKRPRPATRREVRTLRSLLLSGISGGDPAQPGSIAEAAARIRAERAAIAQREALIAHSMRPATGERHRASELRGRLRWSWMRPARHYEEYRDLLAAAGEQLAEQRAAELLEDRPAEHLA